MDIETWLELNVQGKLHGEEFQGTCPYCGKSGKFSCNIEKRLFRCFSGSCQASGRAWQLVSYVSGISGYEARALVGSEFDARPNFQKKKAIENKRWDIPLPEEFIPCYDENRDPQWRVIKYLKERLKPETLRAFGVGFCKEGKYWGRAVIPVSSEFGSAWTARDVLGSPDPKRHKYHNPAGGWASDLLFGWDMYQPGQDLCLVEGPFDVMRLWEHGIPALALLGKELGAGHRAQLLKLPSNTYVTILIDPEEKRWIIDDIHAKLVLKFKNLFSGKLPLGVDPGSSTQEEARKAIDTAKKL